MKADHEEAMNDIPTTTTSVLVCDDSTVERSAVVRLLRGDGYIVHEAADGRAALEALRQKRIDLVVLDLNMPQVDGFGVLDYIQEHRKALPVILLSGLPPARIQSGMGRMRSHELPPLLLKPIDPDQLLSIVSMALSGDLSAEDNSRPTQSY
jgi:two-component system, chemotaxis family, chemotaxis protein CheY